MHHRNGFTLIELVTTLAIVAVLLAIGLPGFGEALARLRVQTAMHRVSTDLAMARSSAIMRRSPVVACPGTGMDGCSGGADWSGGWIVFADPDGNRRPDTVAELLRVSDAPSGAGGRLRLGATRHFVRYQRDGRSAGTNLTVRVCSGEALAGEVIVNNLGRVRSARPQPPRPCSL
ncbi:pilus assembly protein [Lysobacteraceae bacterium NML93-0792]|nr:pilus assembly protein [Xanthomonadaceae bacterium NML93-0792]PBS15241.1 pilus assembly protein [Xanthomonadaceae bacterium NML93-0793]PBS18076.1 pilus assembly protein [Xanthomonadaceae bacterium NML93-0831]